MTRKEIIKVLTLLSQSYESYEKRMDTDEKIETIIMLWQECLGDLDYDLVLQAVKKSIIASPYAPTIHDIRKSAMDIVSPIVDDRLEQWDECYKLICRGSVVTQEEFDSHSEIVKKFLGSVAQLQNYAKSDIEDINTVVKSSFLKQYDIIRQREKEINILPDRMKEMVTGLTDKMDIKMLEGDLENGN